MKWGCDGIDGGIRCGHAKRGFMGDLMGRTRRMGMEQGSELWGYYGM